MEVKGKIYEISETQEVKDNFRKREFILEYSENEKFTEYLKFEAIQDKCELLDNYSAGDEVEVSFNLRGRAWVDKMGKKSYFNSLQAWRLKSAENSTDRGAGGANPFESRSQGGTSEPSTPVGSSTFPPSDEDDLPF